MAMYEQQSALRLVNDAIHMQKPLQEAGGKR